MKSVAVGSLFRLLLVAAVVVGFAGCGENPANPGRDNPADRNNPATGGINPVTFAINGGARWTRETQVTLSIQAPTATQMMVSNDVAFTGALWRAFQPTVAEWELPPGEGMKTVYIQFANANFHGVARTSASIALDRTPPVVSGVTVTPASNAVEVLLPVRLAWSGASDALSGVAGYRVLLDEGSPPTTERWSGSGTSCEVGGLKPQTAYFWSLVVVDGAGNEATAGPWRLTTLDQPAGFVLIQPGTFQMGSPAGEGGGSDETQHWVRLTKGFLLGETEVTQAQWKAVMGTDPSYFSGDNRPVEQVTWFDAVNYCNALSAKEGLTKAYTVNGSTVTWNQSADGYRLPTESEWEYACRAETTTRYWSGNAESDLTRVGWYGGNSGSRTHDVKEKNAPNAWGLHDVHGNVWEWCWDWKDTYPAGTQANPAENPTGVTSGSARVRRGGSWGSYAYWLRSAYRSIDGPSSSSYDFGFRVARTVAP